MKTTVCIFHDTNDSLHDRRVFEIVEEAYGRRQNVVLYTDSEERAAEIDRFLWILRQDSFIPHQVLRHINETVLAPIVILTEEWKPFKSCILVADSHCSIEFACGFSVIHEFVYRTSPQIHESCRDRYRSYSDKKIPVEYLKTGVWQGVPAKIRGE